MILSVSVFISVIRGSFLMVSRFHCTSGRTELIRPILSIFCLIVQSVRKMPLIHQQNVFNEQIESECSEPPYVCILKENIAILVAIGIPEKGLLPTSSATKMPPRMSLTRLLPPFLFTRKNFSTPGIKSTPNPK